MSVNKTPNSLKQFIQSNVGDYQGNLWSTFNIDLDTQPGVIRTSKKLQRVLSPDDFGDDIVQAISIYNTYYYSVTDDRVSRCVTSDDPTLNASWSDVATFNAEDLGKETDAVNFEGLFLISTGTDVMSWDGTTKDNDWWTSSTGGGAGTPLTSGQPHIMEVLRTGNDTLFVTDGSDVRYVNLEAGHTTIALEANQTAVSLTPSLDRMWVGTLTNSEENAFVYEIQVGNDAASSAYPVAGRAALAMFTYRNTPFVITERGYIQAFNGAGFQTVSQFPWATESKVMEDARPGTIAQQSDSRAIHPKGVRVDGKYAYIFVNTNDEYSNPADILNSRSFSGVWVLDLETYSLTHRYSLATETNEYGYAEVTRSAPILLTNIPNTRIMVGGEISNADANRGGLWMESDDTPQGFFTTVRHESESIADTFESFTVKADTLDATDSVTIKSKTATLSTYPVSLDDVTWLDASAFTTTASLTNVEVGDEVFILSGHGAGNLLTITDISGTNTKTVTTDGTIGVLNELSDVQIENWKKHEETMTAENGEWKKWGGPEGTHTACEYKVVLNGEVTVREVISKSNNKEGV